MVDFSGVSQLDLGQDHVAADLPVNHHPDRSTLMVPTASITTAPRLAVDEPERRVDVVDGVHAADESSR